MGGRGNARWCGGCDEVLRVRGSSMRGGYTSIMEFTEKDEMCLYMLPDQLGLVSIFFMYRKT
jgi:hypothetical protein